ncbi:MAG: hypothetical protein CM15mP74_20910 [Halieaceae bacterium]|nr:MAG: hypothetical protein CM15mP74_20910 [Halieaceae bacterium]
MRWHSTCGVEGLAGGVIEALISEMPVAPTDLVAWLGPSIGRHVYEVGPEVGPDSTISTKAS